MASAKGSSEIQLQCETPWITPGTYLEPVQIYKSLQELDTAVACRFKKCSKSGGPPLPGHT